MEFLATLGFVNILAFSVLAFFIMICAATENLGVAILLVIGALVGAWWFHGFNVFLWIYANPGLFLTGIAVYFVAGILWSFFKWDLYCSEQAARAKEEIKNIRSSLVDSANPFHIDPKQAERRIKTLSEPPVAMENKYRFTTWIVLWWASILAFVFDDFFDWLIKNFLTLFGRVYQSIANRHYKDM